MPVMDNPSNEAPHPDYSKLDKQQPSTKSQPTNPPQSQSTATSTVRPPRQDSLDVKLHTGERERDSRINPPDTPSDVTTTTPPNRPRTLSTHKAQSGLSDSNQEAKPERNSSGPLGHEHGAPGDRTQPNSNSTSSTIHRVSLRSAQVAGPSDPQQSQGATEDTSAGGSTAHHSSATSGRRQDAQTPSGHLSEDGHQQDRSSEIKQYTQVPGPAGYSQGFMNSIMSTIIPTGGPSAPKDKYQQLKEEYYRIRDELRQTRVANDNSDRELKRRTGELRRAGQYIGHLEHESQRFKDTISGLQNELNIVHQQLKDAKNLSEVRGKELFGAQVFLTKADTLSISEVGEKVTALNEEIFQAAATLGDALVHKRHEVSQTEFDAAVAESQGMVGEKLTNTLIAQSRKPEPEVNPLLVQVVLQIFMVKFCVSKIQPWYPGDSVIGEFLTAIYSEIRSTEEQAVSGRWRALTRAHTRPTTETWKKELYRKLQSVLVVASWKAQSSEHEDSYGQRLPSIFKAVTELRIAIGEKFTSADLDIFVFKCDQPYEPEVMDDAYSDGRQSSGKRAPETIVGTTGIGLGKIKVERDAAEDDALQVQSIIPAKIVLKSTLNEALEPIQSNRIRKKKKPVESTGTDGAHADPEGRRSNGSKSKAGANVDTT